MTTSYFVVVLYFIKVNRCSKIVHAIPFSFSMQLISKLSLKPIKLQILDALGSNGPQGRALLLAITIPKDNVEKLSGKLFDLTIEIEKDLSVHVASL
ncbi:hypothetical protein KHA80_06840 [Anaerobacillus sp. HL2]|nr:hypothetical protein KHA80_06840 [Anaerobacillus sp. HL2]